ncbi:MAG: serpin family protein [Muribaculaceae bacterium]
MNTKYLITTALLTFAICSCSDDEDVKTISKIDISEDDIAQIQAINGFAFDIFGQLIDAEDEICNKVYTPFGLDVNLAMLANGSEGNTKDEILKVLNYNDVQKLNSVYSKILSQIKYLDNSSTVSLANSIWAQNHISLYPDFVNNMSDKFFADCNNTALNSENCTDIINKWCATQTNNLIPQFLTKAPDCDLLMLSAIYFEGAWTTPFDEKQTVNRWFNCIDGTKKQVKMMIGSFDTGTYYRKLSNCEILDVPFGNGSFYMSFILPDEGTEIREFTKNFDYNEIATVDRQWCGVHLSLPKFKITYDSGDKLNDILINLDLSDMYSEDANFSYMTDFPLLVSSIRQVASIEVCEKKVVASAISEVNMEVGAIVPDISVDINLDRPFLFALREKTTGIYLFLGSVVKF